MTTARVGQTYVETVVVVGPSARVAEVYAEVVIANRPKARVAEVYAEVVVATWLAGGWGVGMVRMNR